MIGMTDILEDYEQGYLDTGETLELFAELIRTGLVRNLEDPYLRTAQHLIDVGYISPKGKITNRGPALMLDEGREGSPCDVNQGIVVAAFDDPIPGAVAVPNVSKTRGWVIEPPRDSSGPWRSCGGLKSCEARRWELAGLGCLGKLINPGHYGASSWEYSLG